MFLHPNFARPVHFPPPGAALTHAAGQGRARGAEGAIVAHNAPQGAFEWHFTSTAPRCLYGLSALIHPRNHANAALSNAQRDIGSSGARREASDAPFTGSSGPELVAPRRRTATARCTPTSSRHPLRKPSARIARPAAPRARGNATDKSRLFQRSDASPPSPGLNFLFSLRRSAPEGRLLLNGGAS